MDSELITSVLGLLAIVFGVGVLFNKGLGNFLAGGTALIAGLLTYNEHSYTPFIIGFVVLWILRLLGFEKKMPH